MLSKKLPAVIATSALLVGVLLAPSAAQAQRGGGRGSGGGGNGAAMGRGAANGRPAVTQQQAPGRQWSGNQWSGHNHFVGRPFFRPFVRPFFPYAVAPAVVYAAPYYYAPPYYQDYPPPAYYNPPQTSYAPPAPTYYAPAPATYSSPPPPGGTVTVAPAPPDNVIHYSHGRYELRGDGESTPYRWVWIPNPPPPPPAAPSGNPSSFVPSPGDSSLGAPVAPRQSQLYRWTDAAGVAHWTDRIDLVPEKHRAGARQYPPS
jgi:Domain of unknown function (DUF4124)